MKNICGRKIITNVIFVVEIVGFLERNERGAGSKKKLKKRKE